MCAFALHAMKVHFHQRCSLDFGPRFFFFFLRFCSSLFDSVFISALFGIAHVPVHCRRRPPDRGSRRARETNARTSILVCSGYTIQSQRHTRLGVDFYRIQLSRSTSIVMPSNIYGRYKSYPFFFLGSDVRQKPFVH